MNSRIAEEMESSKAHVLFISFPVLSHVNPMLNFSKTLTSKGIKVTLATPISISSSVKTDDSAITIEPFDDGCNKGFHQADSTDAYIEMFREVGMKSITKLVQTLQNSKTPVQCVAYSSLIPLLLDVAKEFGVLAAAFYVTPCSANAIHYHVYTGQLGLPVQGPRVSLLGLPLLELHDLPTTVTRREVFASQQFLKLCLNQFPNSDKADWLLFNASFSF